MTTSNNILKTIVLTVMFIAVFCIVQRMGYDPITNVPYSGASTLGHPALVGKACLTAIPLALYLAMSASNLSLRIAYSLSGVILMAGLIASKSRAAELGAVAAIFTLLWFIPQRLIKAALIITLILGILAVSMYGKWAIEKDDNAFGLQTRLHFWEAGLQIIKDNVFFGIGLDVLRQVYPYYQTRAHLDLQPNTAVSKIHSQYLNIAISSGILSLLFYLWFLYEVLKNGQGDMLGICLTASIIGCLVQDLFDWQDIANSMLFYIILGLKVRRQYDT